MTREEIESAIRTIIVDQLVVADTEIEDETKITDLGADSLDTVEIIIKIEDKYGIEFSDEETAKIKTFEDLVDTTLRLIGKGGK